MKIFILKKAVKLIFITLIIFISTSHFEILAQPDQLGYNVVQFSVNSGVFNGNNKSNSVILEWTEIVDVGDVPWIRVEFADGYLGNASFLEIVSMLDGAKQTLNAVSLSEWYNTSAFFNGGKIELRLYVNQKDEGVFINMKDVLTGTSTSNSPGLESICGTEDNRVASLDPAVGRILSSGCSGSIVENGKIVTAGHCEALGSMDIIEFNVPQSTSSGTIQHPHPDHQYSINQQSIVYQYISNTYGYDWAVFEVFNNSNTGLQPIQAQNDYFKLVKNLTAGQLRVTGYGVDGPAPEFGDGGPRNSDNQTEQTHLGSNVNSSGYIIRHTADTQPGNSGSPIIDESTGFVIGVHTNAGCTTSGGYNHGTSTYNTNFWNAVYPPVTIAVDQKRNNGTRLSGTTVGRWNGSAFSNLSITTTPATITPNSNSTEVLKGYQEIVSSPSEKYRVWEKNQVPILDYIQNHHGFLITTDITELTSRFYETQNGITIKNKIDNILEFGNIQFKDPWLVDYPDPLYNNIKRNRGMDDDGADKLDYKTRTSPFYPNLTTNYNSDIYQGVFLNQNPQFQTGLPVYSVKVDAVQNIDLIGTGYYLGNGRQHKFYFQNWSGTNANFQSANNLETPVVFTSDGATAQANLKGTNLTNTQYNWSSGQRSFIKDDVIGHLHNVYCSMGKVWYERSTDNGITWHIMNGGKPFNPSTNAKSPSICQYSGESKIYITYQASETYFPEVGSDGILVTVFPIQTSTDVAPEAHMSVEVPGFNYSNEYKPVIAAHVGSGVVIYDMPSTYTTGIKGFYFLSYYDGPSTSWVLSYNGDVTFPAGSIDQNSTNPSIAADYTRNHLVYEQNQSSIRYIILGNNAYYTISTSSPSYYNLKPTISLLGFQNSTPIISWTGATYNYYGGYTPQSALTRIVTVDYSASPCSVSLGSYNSVNGNIQSISSASNVGSTQKTLITWSYLSGSSYYSRWQRREGTQYTAPATMSFNIPNNSSVSINGIWTQATTDEDFSSPQALVFNNSSSPYYFIPSTTNFVGNNNSTDGGITWNGRSNVFLGKITEDDTIITFGRSGLASINDIEFIFEIGDILVGDSVIRFIEIPDTLVYNSTNELNQHTRTNNFTLTPNTNFYFSNIYHVVQKSDPDTALVSIDAVNFKVELVNASTNQVVGTFDNITLNKTNLDKYASIDYSVDCSGISAGEYYLRLVTNVNGNASYTLANIFNENTSLAKKNYSLIKFTGSEIPTTYDLAQNFPNPFNPSTTIRFQIPQDGIVSLKIYDILGAEVATLVNEQKVAGKYEVNFNASTFASGVYIYKIQAGDFISSKKMILIK